MDPSCINCQNICKRLDSEDSPVLYKFSSLTPNQAILLIEKLLDKRRSLGHLQTRQCQRSEGDQLVLSLTMTYPEERIEMGNEILVIAQAKEEEQAGTAVWFRFEVPPSYCQRPELVGELTNSVNQLVKFLEINDKLLSGNKR